MRVEDLRGISHLVVARSADGVTGWRFDDEPLLAPRPEDHPEEVWGCEDPRLTWLPEREEWAIAYTAYSRRGPLVSLAMTRDFKEVRRLGPAMPPEDKDAALFPRRFDGRWAMVHRPTPLRGGAHMWISYSPDLRHWGDQVDDTPAEAGPNYFCDPIDSCPKLHPNVDDLINNFMDYGDDICLDSFTPGQTARMHANWDALRNLAPVIKSFKPSKAAAGAHVLISGSALATSLAIYFNGVPVPAYTPIDDATIDVIVPAGATTGPIYIDKHETAPPSARRVSTSCLKAEEELPRRQ